MKKKTLPSSIKYKSRWNKENLLVLDGIFANESEERAARIEEIDKIISRCMENDR